VVIKAGGRREGAKERVVVHSAAATSAAHSAAVAPAHDTPSPSSSSQFNGYKPHVDAMRMYAYLRYHASRRGGQCASGELLGSFGGQLLTDRREVSYITRMCPFRPRSHSSRHMQHISGQYWKIVFLTP
jgi:hypothetical protein